MKKLYGLASEEDLKIWNEVVSNVVRQGNANEHTVEKTTYVPLIENHSFSNNNLNKSYKKSQNSLEMISNPKTALIDKRLSGLLRKGKLNPESSLDLHGYNYEQAYKNVYQFVNRSFEENKRLVLIITGKGKKTKNTDVFLENNVGVIKSSLPKWLDSPKIKTKILAVQQAHVSHGGSGAFYIYLRKNKTNNYRT